MQHQQQFGAASSGLPINPVDMLNLMQFHHLMSLNFMNLAPPLVFGGGNSAAAATHQNNSNITPCSSSAADIQLTNSGDSGNTTATVVPVLTQPSVSNSNTQVRKVNFLTLF